MVVHHQRDAEHLESDLLRIGDGGQLAFLHGLLHGALERIDPGALAASEHVAHRAGLVVEFGGAADHRAAAGQLGRLRPIEPVGEHGAQARYAARLRQGGLEHHFSEFSLAVIEHRQQQFLARAEMGE